MRIVSPWMACSILVIFLLALPLRLFAIEDPSTQLNSVGFSPSLSSKVDLNLEFTAEDGRAVALKDLLIADRPAIIVPVYYQCPRLCGLLLSGMNNLLKGFGLAIGSDFQVVVVSFNPSEGPELAAAQRTQYLSRLQITPEEAKGLRFLVGKQESISELMSQIGFRYGADGVDFAHSAGIVLLTPKGEISQFFSGIDFPQRDVQLALVEASRGRIGSALDHIMLFCFRFDATKGRYTWAAFNIMRAGGALTLLLLGGLLFTLWRREQRSRRPAHI